MDIQNKHKIFFGVLAAALVLSACVFPDSDDPFARLPEEAQETLQGEIFPFSVSVSTRATHRLEKDGRLVAFLASDIVQLDDFVGQEVEVDGVRRSEKMRETFWVEAIRLQNAEQAKEEEPVDKLFSTNRFSFIYPEQWEHSTSPVGVTHFVDKNDVARRVFLTFEVQELDRADRKADPNILIANLAGIKKISTDNLDRERQEVTLFSNLYDVKYQFVFTSAFEEFERKKAFFTLLNSFVEGEENVRKAEEDAKRILAEQEAEKVESAPKESLLEEAVEPKESGSILDRIFGSKDENKEQSSISNLQSSDEESDVEEKETATVVPQEKSESAPVAAPTPVAASTKPLSKEFTNLIEAHAFQYESTYYQFRMKVPWGFWFRNFGPSENAIARVGFSDQDFTDASGAKFWLEVLTSDAPATQFSERVDNGQLVLQFPRTDKSFFRMRGPVQFRDAMRSIQATVEKF